MNKFLICLALICFHSFSVKADVFVSNEVFKSLEKNKTADVLVFLNEQASLAGAEKIIDRVQRVQFVYDQLRFTAMKTQAEFLKTLNDDQVQYRSFYLVNVVAVQSATSQQIQNWSKRKDLSKILLDAKTKNVEVPVDQNKVKSIDATIDPKDIPDHLKAIRVDQVWAKGNFGQGIVIAGQDSGYKWDHPALKTQYRGNSPFLVRHDYNWHDAIHSKIGSGQNPCGYNLAMPCDDKGHGTHTMGTMLGFDYSTNTNRIGVAPQSKWIGCRNMDLGFGKASTYLECFEYFLAPYPWQGNPKTDGEPKYAPHIINNSWACTSEEGCTGNEFLTAVQNLKTAGIAIVVSAGNDGSSCGSMQNPPGFYSGELFAVAAYNNRDNKIADFSSRGPSRWNQKVGPNITAPGENIRSSVSTSDLYDYKSGTSMAAPHVSGVIALIWSARPELIGQVDATMKLIEQSAMPKTSTQTCGAFRGGDIPNAVFGYGLIDAYKASYE